jgi:hypothetical protein
MDAMMMFDRTTARRCLLQPPPPAARRIHSIGWRALDAKNKEAGCEFWGVWGLGNEMC